MTYITVTLLGFTDVCLSVASPESLERTGKEVWSKYISVLKFSMYQLSHSFFNQKHDYQKKKT